MTSLHGFSPTPRPTSELRDHLEGTRGAYLERFLKRVGRTRAVADAPMVEALIEVPDEAEPDQLFRLMRADLLVIGAEEATVDSIEGPYAIEDLLFDFDGVPVQIHDLAWENVLLAVRGGTPNIDYIRAWGALWMDVQDERAIDATGLRHVLHRFSRPHITGEGWSISVDFGSADVDAFIELLEIASSNASAIDVWIPG
jgi:hypothetical protein